MAIDCKLLLVWKDILLFTYCVISYIFTGPTQILPVLALGPASFK